MFLTFAGQRNIASLGAGPPQQEDQAYRVSDRQAEEGREMYRGVILFQRALRRL